MGNFEIFTFNDVSIWPSLSLVSHNLRQGFELKARLGKICSGFSQLVCTKFQQTDVEMYVSSYCRSTVPALPMGLTWLVCGHLVSQQQSTIESNFIPYISSLDMYFLPRRAITSWIFFRDSPISVFYVSQEIQHEFWPRLGNLACQHHVKALMLHYLWF